MLINNTTKFKLILGLKAVTSLGSAVTLGYAPQIKVEVRSYKSKNL